MKKLLFLILSITTLGFSGCDPLDDTYTELGEALYTKEMNITLTNDDYKSLSSAPGIGSYVASSYYFKSEDDAGKFIPFYLAKKFPQLDDGSTAMVTYKKVILPFTDNNVSTRIAYTLLSTDYALGGTTFSNFDSWAQILKFLNTKYPSPANGTLATLTFTFYNSQILPSSNTITDSYFYKNGEWNDAYFVSLNDYTMVDRGRYNNFTPVDDAALNGYFDKFLKNKITGPNENDAIYVNYVYRVSANLQTVRAMKFNGINWVEVTGHVTVDQKVSFKRKNGVWIPDLSVKYSMTAADYTYIGDNSTAGTASSRANLKSFGNFYRLSSTSPNYWSDADLELAFGQLLKYKFPNAEIGQKYEITYLAYNGATGPAKIVLELQADGTYKVAI